jgi:hypothetical protein
MKLPDAVVEKLRDKESPVTHAAIIEDGEMIIRYSCDGKAIGQTMFAYTPEAWIDWFRAMMEEMNPEMLSDAKKKVKAGGKRPATHVARPHRARSGKRVSRRSGKRKLQSRA